MNSERRMYFKKQIMKDISQLENASKEKDDENTITGNQNSSKFGTSEDTSVTVLGSSSYHAQNKRILLTKIFPLNEKKIKDKEDGNNIQLEPIDNKKIGEEIYCAKTCEEIQMDIELEPYASIEELLPEKENLDIYNNQLEKVLSHLEGSKINKRTSNQQRVAEEECESSELNPTFTEIIADKELDLMRKSLEEDDNAEREDIIINLAEDKQAQPQRQKPKRSKMKKCYVDFLSDEEDFVWDSSSWKDTGDDSSSSEPNKPEKKKKNSSENGNVGDAGLRKKKVNKRKSTKDARDKGHEYIRKNGSIVSSRSLRLNPCLDKSCGNNCQAISEEKRQNLFDHFWGLPPQRKKDWLIAMTCRSDIKRKRSVESSYRDNTYYYFINEGEGRRKVCKKFLMATLDVSHRYIGYTLANASFGLSKMEARGKVVPKNKTPQVVKESAVNFIKSLPALPSHYCRKDSTRLYLATELRNIKNLYRIYKEAQTGKGVDIVSEKVFRDIFNRDFNIGFHVPKKDKCVKCLRFEGKDFNENPEMMSHLKEKEASKNRLAFHRELCKNNTSILCASFDLQKVLNTPHGQSMLLFYSRKYTVYNLCFYESVTRQGFCYTWGETEGKRGGNEIASILQKYIADVDSRGSVKRLILYSDSCPGQNKNKIVLAAIHNALLLTKHIETIQMNYLLPGHTEMPVDSIHATIENSIRNTIIWAPSQWPTVFQLARKEPGPYHVEALIHSDFKNFDEFSEKYFKGNLSGKISKARVATFKKSSPNVMTLKNSMIEDAQEDRVNIISRQKQLQQKYKTALPITTAKYNDLKKLCDTGVIPKLFHEEYKNFSHYKGSDVLVETDIEDETDTRPSTSD